MNILGIIAEYNPFHNGHLYHLQQCRKQAEADFVVAIMSGNFTQRGEPALFDKWTRSHLAVECGIDLVLELPFAYAVNSAEYFAKGGVGILSRLGCVTHLGFGAETEKLAALEKIAEFLSEENGSFQKAMKTNLNRGCSYAKARELALAAQMGEEAAALSVTPNNILALEYLKQLKTQKSPINPVIVNRKGAGYFDIAPKEGIASATAIRHCMDRSQQAQYVPEPVAEALAERQELSGYFGLIRSSILQKSPRQLSQIFSVGEGLENRMKDQVRRCGSLEELVEKTGSKRYPAARIMRCFCQTVVGLTAFEDSFYARVLAASAQGTHLLRQLKKKSEIPIITNINKEPELPGLLGYDILAGDLYNMISGQDLYKRCDYVMHPYIQKDKTLEKSKQ